MSFDTERLMEFWPALIGVFRNRLPNHAHAVWEDLASDTLERAIRNQHRYEDRGNGPYSWLCVMASNIAIDYLRRRKNPLELSEHLYVCDRATLDAGSDDHLTRLVVTEALERLDDGSRRLLVGYYHEGRKLGELLPGMRTNHGGTSKRLARAGYRLRLVLEGAA